MAKPENERREEIARMIDPASWEAHDRWLSGPHAAAMKTEAANEVRPSLETASRILALPPLPQQGEAVTFQDRAGEWVVACFGDVVACDELERMDRAVEEFYEALQARNYPRERLTALENYTWSRPVGEIKQEIGGMMLTLAAWCQAIGVNMHECGEVELARVWTKVETIRAKQAAKPVGSALPIAAPQGPAEAQARVEALESELRVALSAYAGIIDLGGKLDLLGSNLEMIESAHARVSALLSGSTPKPAGVEIDDAMVERAALALQKLRLERLKKLWDTKGGSLLTDEPSGMRDDAHAALTAALSGGA